MGTLGVVGLAMVLLVVGAVALLRRRFDGRIRTAVRAKPRTLGGLPANRQEGRLADVAELSFAGLDNVLPADRVTVVQFSGEFCAVCPQARLLVERVLRDHPEIDHVELDVAEHLEAVRALDIRRTPTVIIADKQGRAVHRLSGMPREAELRQALAELAART
ncbi:MAG: thioredoxin family protein [Actinomycetota bacterium]|nr:thioredoxin family protein [Actinomycetota bacterium]